MIITLLCLGVAIYTTIANVRFLRVARHARGELVGYTSERDDVGDWLHRPVYRFADANGQLITASNPRTVMVVRRLTVGQQYELLYNPANPAQIWRDTLLDLWIVPAVLWGVYIVGLF